jgi:Ni/Co efflux regulator RcnB
MKKFILAAAVASMLATPALAAPDRGRDNRGQIEQRGDHRAGPQRQVQQRQAQQHRWNRGERFNQRQASEMERLLLVEEAVLEAP